VRSRRKEEGGFIDTERAEGFPRAGLLGMEVGGGSKRSPVSRGERKNTKENHLRVGVGPRGRRRSKLNFLCTGRVRCTEFGGANDSESGGRGALAREKSETNNVIKKGVKVKVNRRGTPSR